MTARIRRAIVHQFHRPTGLGGHLAGWIMGHRRSNVVRNLWAVGRLDIGPAARVLEIGCGPGIAIAALAERVTTGLVVGIDHSPVVIRQAQRRNADAVGDGRVRLVCASVEDLLAGRPGGDATTPMSEAPFDMPFDAVLAVNSMGFWSEPAARLASIRRLLRPGGQIALVSQPRCAGATAATSQSAAGEFSDLLVRAGFTAINSSMLAGAPPVACVRATTPDDDRSSGHPFEDGG
jgi:SAM-dependent methyltransferase